MEIKSPSTIAFAKCNGILIKCLFHIICRCYRHSKTTNGKTTLHLWDGERIVADVVSGSTTARYLRGLNLLAREQDGALQYYLFNAHGDVTGRCDGWGNLLKAYRYDAFGVEVGPEKLDANPFRYCGEYFDRETETVYLRAREYAPGSGRFLSEDSVHSTAGTLPNEQEVIDPLSLNRYTYCHGNPVLYTDPSGNAVEVVGTVLLLFLIIAAASNAITVGDYRRYSQLPGTSLMPPDYYRNKETFPLPEVRQNTAIVEPPLTPKAGPYRESLPTRDDHLSDLTKPAMFPDNTPVIQNGNIWAANDGVIRVGQWMSPEEYEEFVNTSVIPRTNVLVKGMDGYMRQANKGDYYVEFDMNKSLLLMKDEALGWALVKSKNRVHTKLAQKRGEKLPDPIGNNIKHMHTK